MSARSSITLGDLDGKPQMLEIACHRCDRRGRLSLDQLIAEHGAPPRQGEEKVGRISNPIGEACGPE